MIVRHLDQLIGLFNKRGMDLPDGLFDRRTQFRLNGEPYESLLGRAPNDPLVLMLTRGPAGYRFIVKSLQHAVPDAKLERSQVDPDGSRIDVRLSGHLRGSNEPIYLEIPIQIAMTSRGEIEYADAAIDAAPLEQLRVARATT